MLASFSSDASGRFIKVKRRIYKHIDQWCIQITIRGLPILFIIWDAFSLIHSKLHRKLKLKSKNSKYYKTKQKWIITCMSIRVEVDTSLKVFYVIVCFSSRSMWKLRDFPQLSCKLKIILLVTTDWVVNKQNLPPKLHRTRM